MAGFNNFAIPGANVPPTYGYNNQPFQPNYYQPFNGFQNQQPMPQMGQQQPVQNANANTVGNVRGRVIRSVSEVSPQEIASDGSVSLFPLRDESAIYVKSLDQQGNIRTVKYVPEPYQEEQPTQQSNDAMSKIFERLDAIEKRIENLGNKRIENNVKPSNN